MLGKLGNLKTLLIFNLLVLLVAGLYIAKLKNNAAELKQQNVLLVQSNGIKQAANDHQTQTIKALKLELERQNNVVSKQSIIIADIRQQSVDDKSQLKAELETADEVSIAWADEFVPDAVIRMLDASARGGGSNEGNQGITASAISSGYSNTSIIGENKPRPG